MKFANWFRMALVASAPLVAAAGTTCITDVMVVGGENKSVTNSYAAQGWTVIGQDLNAGAGGDYVFLLYKSADSASVSNGFVTGFYIKTGASGVADELTHDGRVYHLAPCAGDADFVGGKGDLNSKTTKPGDVIHLYYTKSAIPGNSVVTGITFNDTQSGAVGTNGGTTGYDLNEGANGGYIYMHVSTATLPYAPEASYLDPTDPGHPEKVCHGYTFVTDQTTLTSGWYVVAGAVTFDNRIYVFGDVNLILMDGAELAANSGVNVGEGNRLTIWAQSTNAVVGKLTARGGDNQAGIGGGWSGAGGEVMINGGTVKAVGSSTGAGIGGGYGAVGGTVMVNGGTVEAYGGECGAGIGGGWSGAGGEVTINGGTVTAKGGDGNAGIGAGYDNTNHGSLSINGMKVGYVESDGKVKAWAAPGDRDGCCRNREEKTVRIEVCFPHVFEGESCKICGDKAHYLDPTDSENPEKVCHDFTVITNQTTLSTGWYVVAGAVANGNRIYVSGDVNIILTDGAELAANGGINVDMNDSITNSLTIWAQSTNAVAGKLTARGKDYADSIMVFRPRSRGRTW